MIKASAWSLVTARYSASCLGTDEVRGDYLMLGTDLETLGDEVYEGGGVDDVSGHVLEH